MSPIKPEEPELIEHSIWQPGPGARAAYIVGSPVIQIQPAIVGRGAPTVSARKTAEQEAIAAAANHDAAKRQRDRLSHYARRSGLQADHAAAEQAAEEEERASAALADALFVLDEERAAEQQRRQHLDDLLIAARQEESAAGARAATLWTAGRNSQRREDIDAASHAIDVVHAATARRRQLEQEIAQSQEPTP